MRLGSFILASTLVAGAVGASNESMHYFVEDDRLVFTNVPDRPDTRPVPGTEFEAGPAVVRSSTGGLPTTIYDPLIERLAARHGMSARLIKALVVVESAFDTHAVSPRGAQGLMQLMPATAAQLGVDDAFDPIQNLTGGTAHLRDLLDEFGGDLDLALAAYNAGAAAVRRFGGVPPYPETRAYVRKIRARVDGRDEAAASPPPRPIRLETMTDGSIRLSN